jgi:hypothetical protein
MGSVSTDTRTPNLLKPITPLAAQTLVAYKFKPHNWPRTKIKPGFSQTLDSKDKAADIGPV